MTTKRTSNGNSKNNDNGNGNGNSNSNSKISPLRCGMTKKASVRLVFAAVEVGFDFGDGVEALGDEVGVGDFYVELALEAGDEVGEGEGVEGAGVEEALVGGGIVGEVGYCVDDFEDACLGAHGFTCFGAFVTACVAFDAGEFISFPVLFGFHFVSPWARVRGVS